MDNVKFNLSAEQQAQLGPEPIADGHVVIEFLDDRTETVWFEELRSWSDGVSLRLSEPYRPYIYLNYHDNRRVQIPREQVRKVVIYQNSPSVTKATREWHQLRGELMQIRAIELGIELPPERI